jgi:hypothetical protein
MIKKIKKNNKINLKVKKFNNNAIKMNMKKTVKIIKKGMMMKNKRFLIPFKINKIKNG